MTEIYQQWMTKGTGPGVRCFNFVKLSRYGICRTASSRYDWGFCSRSCTVGTSFKKGEGMTVGEVELEMAVFKYYDDAGLFAAWIDKWRGLFGEDKSKTT